MVALRGSALISAAMPAPPRSGGELRICETSSTRNAEEIRLDCATSRDAASAMTTAEEVAGPLPARSAVATAGQPAAKVLGVIVAHAMKAVRSAAAGSTGAKTVRAPRAQTATEAVRAATADGDTSQTVGRT
eukprot:scaffold6871_cov29-Tisochrysis_lutea.AAC.6